MSTAALSALTFDEATHTYRLDGVAIPSVTQVLAEAGFSDWLKHVDADVLEYTSERGKAMHRAIALLNDDALDWGTVDPVIAPRLDAYANFCNAFNFIPVEWEMPLYHPTLRYAGTPDVLGTLRGELAIVDYKSGAVPESVALQLAGYCGLLPREHTYRRYSLALRADGTYRLREHLRSEMHFDRRMFETCLTIANFKRLRNIK